MHGYKADMLWRSGSCALRRQTRYLDWPPGAQELRLLGEFGLAVDVVVSKATAEVRKGSRVLPILGFLNINSFHRIPFQFRRQKRPWIQLDCRGTSHDGAELEGQDETHDDADRQRGSHCNPVCRTCREQARNAWSWRGVSGNPKRIQDQKREGSDPLLSAPDTCNWYRRQDSDSDVCHTPRAWDAASLVQFLPNNGLDFTNKNKGEWCSLSYRQGRTRRRLSFSLATSSRLWTLLGLLGTMRFL